MRTILVSIALACAALGVAPAGEAKPLVVCCTVTDLGEIARAVGGDRVSVTVFAAGGDDPHQLEARPSFVRQLADADLFLSVGLELEIGWAPVLMKNARNPRVMPGQPGYLEAADAIEPLEKPTGTIDRSSGDVHAAGNPHFLSDPLSAMKVAALTRDRLIALRAADGDAFKANYDAFATTIGAKLVGDALAHQYDAAKLALLAERGKLDDFLKAQGDTDKLAGWLGRMKPYAGKAVIADHAQWPYLARRFDLRIAGFLEPKPGVPPTSRHLQEVIALMKADGIRVVLSSPFVEAKHARLVAQATSARVAEMSPQCGAMPGTDRYVDCVEHNVAALAAAFAGAP